MGLQQQILDGIDKGFKAVDDIMEIYTHRSITSTYDPLTSETVSTVTSTDIKGFIDSEDEGYTENTIVGKYDFVIYLQPLTVYPKPGDTMVVRGIEYDVVKNANISVGDVVTLHQLWLLK